MKKLLSFLLALALLFSAALADPLVLLEDYADDAVIAYDPDNPDAGRYEYSYRFPHVDDSMDGGAEINSFYEYKVKDTQDFTIPINGDYYRSEGIPAKTEITYQVTCNNDDYFSVLFKITDTSADFVTVSWEGHVFCRREGKADSTYTLPQLLGILAFSEDDTWLQDRQTAKAEKLIREMVWNQISKNTAGIPYDPEFTEEVLESCFHPEEDFYLDETGNPVFFLQPGVAAPEEIGLLTFPLSLEDIKDEL